MVKIKTAAAILVGSGRRCSDEEYILQRAAKGLADAEVPADAEVVPAQVVLLVPPADDDDEAPPPSALLLSSLLVRHDGSLIAVIVLRGSMVMMFAIMNWHWVM